MQGLEQENEDVVDGFDFEDREGDDDGVGLDGGGIDPQAHYEAFLDVLLVVRGSEIKDMIATSALRRLDEEARAVDPSQDDKNNPMRVEQAHEHRNHPGATADELRTVNLAPDRYYRGYATARSWGLN
jgi:hypothetical protein